MVWQVPDAVDTVVCAPDDGLRYHPKHVEQFPEINKLCNFASCWIYIRIYFRCTGPLTFKKDYFLRSGRLYFMLLFGISGGGNGGLSFQITIFLKFSLLYKDRIRRHSYDPAGLLRVPACLHYSHFCKRSWLRYFVPWKFTYVFGIVPSLLLFLLRLSEASVA